MTAPTYTQQQSPHLFGQTPGYDPLNAFGTSPYGFQPGFGSGTGQQWQQPWTQQPWTQQPWTQWGPQSGQQQYGPQQGPQYGQFGQETTTLVWQLLGYAQQSIQLAQQIVLHSIQQQQLPYQMMGQPRGFQRQPMAW